MNKVLTPDVVGDAVATREEAERAASEQAGLWHETIDPRPTIYHIAVHENEDGSFTGYVVELPGVVSEADVFDDLLEMIEDAFAATVGAYRASGRDVPWEAREPDEGDDIAASITLDG